MSKYKGGDHVLVRGKVLKVGDDEELGYGVELFSKTDQYIAWVRPDLIVCAVEAPLPPEPDHTCSIVQDASGDFWRWSGQGWAHPAVVRNYDWEEVVRTFGPVKVYEQVS